MDVVDFKCLKVVYDGERLHIQPRMGSMRFARVRTGLRVWLENKGRVLPINYSHYSTDIGCYLVTTDIDRNLLIDCAEKCVVSYELDQLIVTQKNPLLHVPPKGKTMVAN